MKPRKKKKRTKMTVRERKRKRKKIYVEKIDFRDHVFRPNFATITNVKQIQIYRY